MTTSRKKIHFVGFDKEFNEKVFEQTTYSEELKRTIPKKRERIINYLEKGEIVIAWMGYFIDKEEKLISPDCYYTDGNYIWPSYFTSFIKDDYNYSIDENFIDYLESVNYSFPKVDSSKLIYIRDNFSKVLVSTPPSQR